MEKLRIEGPHLVNLLDFSRSQGIDLSGISTLKGVDESALCQPGANLSAAAYLAILGELLSAGGGRSFGLRYGQYLNLKALAVIHEVSLHVATVREALVYLDQYLMNSFPLISTQLDLDSSTGLVFIRLNAHDQLPDEIAQTILDSSLIFMYRELVLMRGNEDAVEGFIPGLVAEDWRMNGIEEGKHHFLKVDQEMMNLDLNAVKRLYIGEILPLFMGMLNQLKGLSQSFASMTRKAVLDLADPRLPEQEEVASYLNVSKRSLQRKLRSDGTSFREIIEGIKLSLADHLLMNERLSIQDISFILGFSEPSAFQHFYANHRESAPGKARKKA